MNPKETKVIALLALIIGLASVGQFGLAAWQFLGADLWVPQIVARVIVSVLFWASLIFVIIAINTYRKL